MNTRDYTITAQGVGKRFGRMFLFRGLDIELASGESLCVTGRNGSGKSTLLRIFAKLLAPTEGTVTHAHPCDPDRTADPAPWAGYTGPLVNPYQELTAMENILFSLRGPGALAEDTVLVDFGLEEYRDRQVRHLSSGMVQRLRLAMAAVNDPPALILDEPGTNLDEAGRTALASYLDRVRASRIIIIATNDRADERLCGRVMRLGR